MRERIDYQGPAKSALWDMIDFHDTGGTVEWHETSDTRACATFKHPETTSITIEETSKIRGRDRLMADVMIRGIKTVFGPIEQQHWLNYTKSHAGIPANDPVFDQYKIEQIVY